MRAKDVTSRGKPIVYLDMDGVLADFFAEYAVLAGLPRGSSYRDIPPAKTDPTLNKMVGTDFFSRLPKFGTADALVNMIVKQFGSYDICSSPLRGDHEGSAKWKRVWIQQHLNPQPKEIVITSQKQKYAMQPDGTPNILIDDRGANISAWEEKGGIGIKYQADENSLETIVAGLKRADAIIAGKEKHEPQQLVSKDRSLPVATPQDDPEHELKEDQSIEDHKDNFMEMFRKFLPIAMKYIGLKGLPKMKFTAHVSDDTQPTFGKYANGVHVLEVSLLNRHPNDILRTLAHELVHYKQDTNHELHDDSGKTGSKHENQAHAVAGVVMRHFNKQYPEYLNSKPIIESAAWQKSSGKNKNGGLNQKGVDSYRREHPGSHLQTAVTTKPSKLKPGSKSAKRRKSFCSRMKGMKKHNTSSKTAHDPNSRINKSLRKWNCESIEQLYDVLQTLKENAIAESN